MSLDFNILAAMSSDEIFRNMGQTMDQPVNPNTILLLVVGLLGLIVLLALVQKYVNNAPAERRSVTVAASGKASRRRTTHNPAKLTRELAKQLGLRSGELRQLKAMAEREGIEHPLALLLCPSVLGKLMKK